MSEAMVITCPAHNQPLVPDHDDIGALSCPEGDCELVVRIAVPDGMFSSPLTPFGQTAAGHHELVTTYQQAGFSRSEGMQVLCCIITAGVMKDRGNG